MKSSVVRFSLVTVIVGLVVFGPGMKSYSQSNTGVWIDVLSFHWGVTQTDFARVCVANTRTGNEPPTETIALTFVQIKNEVGQTLIRRELRIPVNEFQCTDLTYRQLGDAGLGTEPSGRRQFLINVIDGTSNTPTSAQPGQLDGSLETIDVETTQTRIYQGIHWRFDNTRN